MARQKVRAAADQRDFTLVYNDFLESDVLNYYEKIIFISIKKFANNKTLKAFPSLNTLHKMTGISKSKIQEVIASLESKGVLKVERRINEDNRGYQSNLYTLYDFAELWTCKNSVESKAAVDKYDEERAIDYLKTRGYSITKEKELDNPAPAKVAEESNSHSNQLTAFNTISNSDDRQEEKYPMEEIRKMFDYHVMIDDDGNKVRTRDINIVMDILYDIFNTSKPTVKIGGEDKPTAVVISRLKKLTAESIMYAIKKYDEQTDRITNPIAYLTTILYNAPEQYSLDTLNQVNYDMARWDET